MLEVNIIITNNIIFYIFLAKENIKTRKFYYLSATI